MQDLPEELWHDSFRFYVKEDPTRRGGPNLRLIRLRPDKPSLTVTAYIFNKFVHPYEDRFISVREAARLQGFPDEVKFHGTLTGTQLQVGNAVPVPLARAVFKQISHHAILNGVTKKPLKALSLFSGAGGMDIGAEQTGYVDTKVALEYIPDACATLRDYYGERACVLHEDISKVEKPSRLWSDTSGLRTPPDIIFGGPPCQAFSQAGKQKGFDDERGQMIPQFLRFVSELQPSYFVMENVANLRGTQSGTIYRHILEKMDDLGYNVQVSLLLAADYGAPQLRRRLFFLGCRKDVGVVHPPAPIHSADQHLFDTKPYMTVEEAFAGLLPATFKG